MRPGESACDGKRTPPVRRPGTRSARKWIERGLLLLGLLLLSAAAAGALERVWVQGLDASRLDAAHRASLPDVPALQEDDLVGRLEITRVGLAVSVREGTGAGVLRVAAGHLSGSSLPGEAGNVVVAGHRDSAFRPLRDVHPGDLVRFVTPRRTLRYRVTSTVVVPSDRVGVLEPTADRSLTLITCYPFSYIGPAPERFIVRAVEVSSNLASAPENPSGQRPNAVTVRAVTSSRSSRASR